jgi:hypothetical protein
MTRGKLNHQIRVALQGGELGALANREDVDCLESELLEPGKRGVSKRPLSRAKGGISWTKKGK